MGALARPSWLGPQLWHGLLTVPHGPTAGLPGHGSTGDLRSQAVARLGDCATAREPDAQAKGQTCSFACASGLYSRFAAVRCTNELEMMEPTMPTNPLKRVTMKFGGTSVKDAACIGN